MMRQQRWKPRDCVLCLSSGGQEKHAVTGTMLFLPKDTEYVMKSECERKKKWQTRSGRR